MMTYYADVLPGGRVRACLAYEQPEVGPPEPLWEGQAQGELVRMDSPIDWASPTSTAVLHLIDGQLEWVETADVEMLRALKNKAINAWKLKANNTYFEFGGKQIAYKESDRVEIQAINNVVLLTGGMPTNPDWPGAWKAIDNTWLPLPDVETWTAFNLAIAARGTAHFKRAQELKALLVAAQTPAEVEAVRW